MISLCAQLVTTLILGGSVRGNSACSGGRRCVGAGTDAGWTLGFCGDTTRCAEAVTVLVHVIRCVSKDPISLLMLAYLPQPPHILDSRATCEDMGRKPGTWHCSRLSWTLNLSTRFKCLANSNLVWLEFKQSFSLSASRFLR